MDNLPVEIIEHLLSYNDWTISDILSFSTTCSQFREIVCNSNHIWKHVYSFKWPQFKYNIDHSLIENWYEEVKHIFNLAKRAHEILADMSPRFYKRYELSDSDLIVWQELMNEYPPNYFYLTNELMTIVNNQSFIHNINVVPINTPGNYTYRYYASKALRFVRQQFLKNEWHKYMLLPVEEQVLERGAVIIAQWCQPTINVTLRDTVKHLDDIAELVRNILYQSYPNHPLFSTSVDIQTHWKTHNLNRNQWSVPDCRVIMDVMGVVLYKHLGFHGNNEMYYIPENSYINEVLHKKRALPITLAIVYDGVARRLGVKCEPISFPAHFLLRWSYGPGEDDSFYIDVYNQGQIIKRGSCPHAKPMNVAQKNNTYPPSTAKQVMTRMANNLELSGRQHVHPNGRITRLRSVLELLRLVNPSDLTCMLNLARLYMLYNMDVSDLRSGLMNQDFFDVSRIAQARQIVQMLQDHEAHHKDRELYPRVEIAPRTQQLRYAVGMVMRHMGLNYICVIYDWDPRCLASPDWQEQMNVHLLTLRDQQPFYNVLVEDGSHRYVAQENIQPTAEAGSLHEIEDIGRHFSHFYETHFVPNAEKEREYPDDSNVRHVYHQKLMFGLTQ